MYSLYAIIKVVLLNEGDVYVYEQLEVQKSTHKVNRPLQLIEAP